MYNSFCLSVFAQVLEDPTDGGVKSTLIIRNSRYEQFGAYNCTASNYYGSDSIEITLTPKSKYTNARPLHVPHVYAVRFLTPAVM